MGDRFRVVDATAGQQPEDSPEWAKEAIGVIDGRGA